MTLRERVESAAVDELPGLAAELAEAQAALTLRLHAPPRPTATPSARLIDDREAATIAGTSRRWINSETAGMRFRHDLSQKQKRYDEAGLRAWLATRH